MKLVNLRDNLNKACSDGVDCGVWQSLGMFSRLPAGVTVGKFQIGLDVHLIWQSCVLGYICGFLEGR